MPEEHVHSPDAASRRLRCDDIERFPFGRGEELVYSRRTSAARVLPSRVAAWLENAREPRTVAEHARDWTRAEIGPGDGTLEALVACGLLVAPAELLATPAEGAAREPVRIATIGMVTCDRVAGVARGLPTYIDNTRRHGRTCDFVVVDDSASAETRALYRRDLRALGERHGVPIHYAGLEEKARFAKELAAESGAPADVVRFALFDVEGFRLITPGANRNALALHTAGDVVFNADDDTLCRVAASGDGAAGLAFVADEPFSSSHPYDIRTFEGADEALAAARLGDDDFLAPHEQVLGATAAECIAGGANGLELSDARGSLLENVRAGRGRVRLSLNGALGDSGWGSPSNYLLLTGAALDRWLGSEAEYRRSLTRRQIHRTVPRRTLSDQASNMMSMLYAVDTRELTPPFLPTARAEDAIFGLTVSRSLPEALIAHQPWALVHQPLEPRNFWGGELARSASGIDVAFLIASLIRSCPRPEWEHDAARNLKALGAHFRDLGQQPAAVFEDVARRAVIRHQSALILRLEQRLDERRGQPEYWAADVRQFVERMQQCFLRPESIVPLELLYHHDVARARALSQRLVLMFGRLLEAWPQMVEAAKALRARGRRLAQPL
jgi:hypothetical protein